jgi:hypothetical protein
MSVPIWLTQAGDLGIIPEQEYYEFVFDAYNTGGGILTYSVIAGALPVGLEIKQNGLMIGIPTGEITGVPASVNKVTTSKFTVRIKNSQGNVADRTFTITVAGLLPQQITPESSNLGTYVDGSYVYADINTIEPNPLLISTFSIINGSLPDGLTLDTVTGVISGYLSPVVSTQDDAAEGFDKFNELTNANVAYDVYPYDFSGVSTSKNYQFTIEANNGISIETKVYTIFVFAIDALTADSDLITADNYSLITADILGPYHVPVILSPAGSLGKIRQNTVVDIQILGKDFDGDQIVYVIDSGVLPTGLTLDPESGWISGIVPYGQLGSTIYTFSVSVYKTDLPEYVSNPVTFTLQVLGQINNTVTWNSPSDLGSLVTGEISQLSISASTPSGRNLNYSLVNSAGRLPIGLELTIDGLLIGRASFETFMLDSSHTTIDNGNTTFDQVYTFTVSAYDTGNFVYDTKDFVISIVKRDLVPYENLYITALPDRAQRQIYNGIIDNADIFPQEYLYRPSDPWFGKNTLRRSLFLAGLNPDEAETYINSMTLNHYWKTLNWGEIKTARALDSNFDIQYEVVYIELIDRQVNSSGVGPNLSVSLQSNSRNISTVYPNSFPNMASRLETGVGYENRSSLPAWMTSRQVNGKILGFTRALVLCYTLPGRANEIAYRVKQIQDLFKSIDFTIDRYEWDNSLSNNFDKSGNVFIMNNFAYASGTISTSTSSNVITGLTLVITGAGTISGTIGNAVITGYGTSFGSELRIGRPIYNANSNVEIGTIRSINSATSLVLENPISTTISNIAYTAETSSTSFTSEIYVGDTIVVDTNVRLGTVKSINSDSNITLYANSLATVSNVTYMHNARDPVSTPGQGDKYLKYPQVGVIT